MSYAESVKKSSNNITNSKATENSLTQNFKRQYSHKNIKILIYTGSLIDVKVEAIANSIDESIDFTGIGLAALILKKYGKKIEQESRKKASTIRKIASGLCFEVETKDKEPPKYILNVVSPYYNASKNQREFESDLFETFTNLFKLTHQLKLKQIALPLLCTGVYNAPKYLCANILAAALKFVIESEKLTLEEIHLVNIDDEATKFLVKAVEFELSKQMDSLEQKQSVVKGEEMENNLKEKESNGFEVKVIQKKNSSIINCQACRQLIRTCVELRNCDHKICTTCLFDFKLNENKCIVEGCSSVTTNQNLKSCNICFEDTLEVDFVGLINCKHKVCKICYKKLRETDPKCPFCQEWFAKPIGTQPKGGEMTYLILNTNLLGFLECKTIEITYYFPRGIQESNHPSPGKPYESIIRTAYLPANDRGLKILELLKKAFEQRLTFTIGDSRTTGASGVITWNDIHHKTSLTGEYGYPDKNYLDRVISELKAKGIQ